MEVAQKVRSLGGRFIAGRGQHTAYLPTWESVVEFTVWAKSQPWYIGLTLTEGQGSDGKYQIGVTF